MTTTKASGGGGGGLATILGDTVTYWRAVATWLRGGAYGANDSLLKHKLPGDLLALRAKVHVFSLCLALRLWDAPHYRKSSYAADVRDNFRNVAIPGTGIPLSVLAVNKTLTTVFLIVGYPLVCFAASVAHARRASSGTTTIAAAYREQLLAPRDWFSLWRINSRLAAWHSLATRSKESGSWHEYAMENKWAFLEKGMQVGVPVSPVLKAPSKLCIKHRNEEGGMGIYFYKNALDGGDWIIQEVLENADAVAALLPADAPLSTFRVMTASRMHRLSSDKKRTGHRDVEPVSCVFRAGRAGALTDHSSILFDVDLRTGTVGRGTTNRQWYQLGWRANCLFGGDVAWGPPAPIYEHPDVPGRRVTGAVIPNFRDDVLEVAVKAHEALLPRVPLAGWDVVLAKGHGPCLFEVNLSCNFFRGSFDEPNYYHFVDQYFDFCEQKERDSAPVKGGHAD